MLQVCHRYWNLNQCGISNANVAGPSFHAFNKSISVVTATPIDNPTIYKFCSYNHLINVSFYNCASRSCLTTFTQL